MGPVPGGNAGLATGGRKVVSIICCACSGKSPASTTAKRISSELKIARPLEASGAERVTIMTLTSARLPVVAPTPRDYVGPINAGQLPNECTTIFQKTLNFVR